MREWLETLAKARESVCDLHTLATAFSSRALTRIATRVCALSLTALFALPAAGAAIEKGTATVTGGEVVFFGATETNWLNGTEFLLKFEGEGSFTLPGLSKVRILAIGGGGGGGGVCTASSAMSTYFGAGGGGGAGGFIDTNDVFSAATYSVVVGAGGPGGASSGKHSDYPYSGSSGFDTVVSIDSTPVITAFGGGGGGGETNGVSGASGGGGSQYRSGSSSGQTRAGGKGIDGQGFAGGNGNRGLYGGGGGGAGGAGAAASTTNPVGGDGLPSDITGKTLWYAAGGGGGYCNKDEKSTTHAPISGGNGGGGNGGYGLKVPCSDATFYGCGGGGSGALATSSTTPGGSGYQGVVYVRISIVSSGELVKPTDMSVDFDGKEHVLVPWNAAYKIVDMTPGSPTYDQPVDKMAGTLSGTYKAKVTLVDGFKWSDGTDDEVTVTLTISKATPVISNLSIRDWIEGTPLEATPNPGCDVSIAVTPTYWYGESETGPWKAEKPTAAGDYWLRAYIEGTESYNEAVATKSFKIVKGPGDIYRDYVEIAIDGVSPAKTDFVYALKLGEGNPVGFLYSRAGSTGDNLAVTDAEGNKLDYKVEDSWNPAGESTIYIKLPTLPTTGLKIRLFWYLREGMVAPEHPGEVGDASEGQPGCAFDLVVRDGKRVNYWLDVKPSLTTDKWDVLFDTPATVKTNGVIREGTSALLYVTNLNTGAVYDGIENIGGSFSAVFGPHDPAGDYEPMEYFVDYYVIDHITYDDLSGDTGGLTQSGRVLLANDDSASGGHAVSDQSYWQKDSSKYSIYWEHSVPGDPHALFPYLNINKETRHILYAKDSDGNAAALWTLSDVFIGSTYNESIDNRCYLPNSPTAKAISSEKAEPGLAEQGTMVMRNKEGAYIRSSTYTNGIGTIYFDVVNACNEKVTNGYYKIQVQVSVDGGAFEPRPMKPFKREETTYFTTNQTDTTELTLEIKKANTADAFYRVAVPVDVGGNVQFQIVRTAESPINVWGEDENGFILVDNILVSYPKSTARLEPYGEYDKRRTGKQVVGWGGAMSVPFPGIGDAVYARANAIINTNSNAHVDEKGAAALPIPWAHMHYQWRYLDQLTNGWSEVNLRPSAGFASLSPLELPAKEGDVEFWYEYIIQVPAYKYYDYSGMNLDLKGEDNRALYSEDVTDGKSTQANVNGHSSLPSGATDWFFRLRRGRSDWQDFTVYVKEKEAGEVRQYDMELVGNHIWRGFCPMRTNLVDGLYVRIAGRDMQTPWATEHEVNTNRYSLAGNVDELPATGVLVPKDNDEAWEWLKVPCDAKTGKLLIQLQDDTLAYTVVHADRQDFNGWTDANKDDGKGIFVGTWKDGESTPTIYTTPDAIPYSSNFTNWNETVATNAYWTETFFATKEELDAKLWPLYEPFDSALSVNKGLTLGPGQWVNGCYRDNATGMALQMQGRGEGYIQLVNPARSPRGLEMVTFKTRIAQAIEFDDFCYFGMTDSTVLTNYTFMTAAAFDTCGRTNFSGNASLSLVALYTPKKGCYELRVEQENAEAITGKQGEYKPGNTFRLTLYRWHYDPVQGAVVATELGSDTASDSGMFNTKSEDGDYARLFISVKADAPTKENGITEVVVGFSFDSLAEGKFLNQAKYHTMRYKDGNLAKEKGLRLTSGTFGLLSANCPAQFASPVYNLSAITYPTGGNDYSLTPIASSKAESCWDDIVGNKWVIDQSRMEMCRTNSTSMYGIRALVPSNTVSVYKAPEGTVDWEDEPIMTKWVTGFGSAGASGSTTTVPLYSLDSCSVKIVTGGTKKTARVDVTVDDIEFRQWRGESYDDNGQAGVFGRTNRGSPTNIVFTQGWVSNGVDPAGNPRKTCLLSARRSYPDVATSIRSPRLVDTKDDEKGFGLGSVVFDYENAQSNAVVLVQIATNDVSVDMFDIITKSVDEKYWVTQKRIDFSTKSEEERKQGSEGCYIGLHGVRGAMRIVLDPERVAEVANTMDPTAFGEITITGIKFTDEPKFNEFAWWGFNMRTTDDPTMRSLADNPADGVDKGLSFGLNNSVSDDIRTDEDKERYKENQPFVQTPTFSSDKVNEVSFLARLYSPTDEMARVTLYGASDGGVRDAKSWTKIWSWNITNTTFETYTKRFGPNNPYRAYRLSVAGVEGIAPTNSMPSMPTWDHETEHNINPARRVLLDDVVVMEGIVATVSFRNVGAFRIGLEDTTAAVDVPSPGQQPLVGEQWGVQCEIFASQLADEISLSNAVVRLWWYDGVSPWGFDKWRNSPDAGVANLMRASDSDDSRLVYRSCHFGASKAVMKAQTRRTTVQYMLEVVYTADGSPQTNWLSKADWSTPSWYAPIDNNEKFGDDKLFSAYTILDTVAPGWAWINEMNIFGEYKGYNYDNTDKMLQFVEIAAPGDADMTDWSVQFLVANLKTKVVHTNEVARFGYRGLQGRKAGLKGMDIDSKCVFHVVASPFAKGSLSADDGQLDGTWSAGAMPSTHMGSSGELNVLRPQSVQLVRPSGIVEHSVVFQGNDDYYDVGEEYQADKIVDRLNSLERTNRWFLAGMDTGGIPDGNAWSRSVGVTNDHGSAAADWTNAKLMTPGEKNVGQVIGSQPPKPLGSALIIYSILQGGHITQTFGESVDETNTVTLVYRKGAEEPTNIVYRTDRWFEIGAVTNNGVAVTPQPTGNKREWILPVGANVSNDVTVVASAQLQGSLVEDYGLGPGNRYTDAVLEWLVHGKTHARDGSGAEVDFHDPYAETLGLAYVMDSSPNYTDGNVLTNLTLTEMYWLDIDPTWNKGDIRMKGYISNPAQARFVPETYDPVYRAAHTNISMTVFMQITNTAAGGPAWAPYILQGTDFAGSSWEYVKPASRWQWTNVTFKVSGILLNDRTSKGSARNWIPVRWFVFDSESFDDTFQAEIEVDHPYSSASPGYGKGWYEWGRTHEYKDNGFNWKWQLDDKAGPVSAEVLRPDSTLR